MIELVEVPLYTNYQISICSNFVKSIGRWITDSVGKVYWKPERFLSIKPNQDGYPTVYIHGLGKVGIHQLMAWTFNGPQPEGTQVLHRDDNKLNNLPGNLYYGTPQDNMDDKLRNGHYRCAFGEEHGQSKLSEAQVAYIYERLVNKLDTCSGLAIEFQVSIQTVCNIKNKATWRQVTDKIGMSQQLLPS